MRGEPAGFPAGAVEVVACEVTDRALVLGSAQPATDVDEARCAELGIALARRRSGGGAVLVAPGAQVWIDLFVPAGDRRHETDVNRSFLWLGATWAAAVRSVTAGAGGDVSVVAPGVAARPFARTLCFASLGAGEVVCSGRKVVGISQRRDRRGSWFHSVVPLADCSTELLDCLRLAGHVRTAAAAELARLAGWLDVEASAVLEAFLDELGRS